MSEAVAVVEHVGVLVISCHPPSPTAERVNVSNAFEPLRHLLWGKPRQPVGV